MLCVWHIEVPSIKQKCQLTPELLRAENCRKKTECFLCKNQHCTNSSFQ